MDEVYTFRRDISENLRPSWPNTTTITVTSCFLKEHGVSIDKSKIERVFSELGTIPVYYGNIKTPFIWRHFFSDFYNQTSIGYEDSLSMKKVKIFPNGSLQIAGCSDMEDFSRFVKQLIYIMKLVYKVDIPESSFKVAMFNSSFSLNHLVDVYKLIEVIERKGYTYQYDPDRYSAVKMKIAKGDRKVTVSVFVSGSVLITGGSCERDIAEIYIDICSMCISHGILLDENRIKKNNEVYKNYPIEKYF